MANSIFTYFISYNFNCGKGNKKEETTSIYLEEIKKSRISTFFYVKNATYAVQILFLSETDISYLSQVRFEQFTTITLSKSSNCFFFNLANALTCESKLIADFL